MATLNERQLKFIELYLAQPAENRSATKAYSEAGYKCKNQRSAEAGASQLLRNIEVQRAINEGLKAVARTEERVVAPWCPLDVDGENSVELFFMIGSKPANVFRVPVHLGQDLRSAR
jgi:hypothetical protein